MAAKMRIDQVGLDEIEPGLAREDGLDDGSPVTVISTAHATTFEVNLLWVGQHPDPDGSSVQTLQPYGANGYRFTPTAGCYGSWRIELVTDRGTPLEDRQIRIFAIKPSPTAIRIPAANERSDPDASLRRKGADMLGRSEFNAPVDVEGAPDAGGTFVSHWRAIADTIHQVNESGGGGGGTLAGDVTGGAGNNTVVKLQGREVEDADPDEGDVLTWSDSTGWTPEAPAGGGGGAEVEYLLVPADAPYTSDFAVNNLADEKESHSFIETLGPGHDEGALPGDPAPSYLTYTLADPTDAPLPGRRIRFTDCSGQAAEQPIRLTCSDSGRFAVPGTPGAADYVEMTVPYGTIEVLWMPNADPAKRRWLVIWNG